MSNAMAPHDEDAWDYIVVGAGSSGCVIANRLSASPDNKVLLLEAGGSDKSLFIQMPAATYINGIGNPKFDWNYPTEPDPTIGGRTHIWPRGKVIGGSSSINGMLYVRGFPQDYDHWRQLGNAGWSWQDVLPLFKRQEDNVRGPSEYHGTGGPLKVGDLQDPHPIARIFIEAAKACGHPYNPDLNGQQIEGFGYVQATQSRGWRCSSAKAFIDPVRHRPNLDVRARTQVSRIVMDANRAVGVEITSGGKRRTLHVRKEVIVSSGSIASPQLLMLSGIGDPEQLQSHGITVAVPSPQVGFNLQDHPGIAMNFEVSIPTFNSEMVLWKQLLHGANWLFRGKGIGTSPDAHLIGFIRSGPEVDIPDIQIHVTPAGYRVDGEGDLVLKENSFTVVVSVCRPLSRGRIGLNSADPEAAPAIHHRLFDDPHDLAILARGIQAVLRIARTSPLDKVIVRSIEPPWNDPSYDEIEAYLIRQASTIYHPAGTCRMGADAESVVDPELKVRGAIGLRVADASIMPTVPSGNLNAPCMMIGEKAAEYILAENEVRSPA